VWLVLCSPADRPAIWAACGLRRRGVVPIEVVSAEALLLAPVWDHRIGSDGTASSTVRLHDGRVLEYGAIDGVLNRLGTVPAPSIGPSERDRAYIQQEHAALLLSWLASLRHVINAATALGLAGAWHSPAHSQWLAAAAGLPVFPHRYRGPLEAGRTRPAGLPRAAIIVFDGRVFGARVPFPLGKACVAYAQLAQTRLVGLELVYARGQWVFDGATPMPNLDIGGDAFLDALAAAMRNA
jgi:hypothetical protein